MRATAFLELFFSVSLQAAVVVAAAYWTGKLIESERSRCRLWAVCYSFLVLLVINAVALPHIRLVPPFRPLSRPLAADLVSIEVTLGRVLFGLWIAGGIGSLGLLIYRCIQGSRFLRTCQAVDPDVVSLASLATDERNQQPPYVDHRPVRLLSTTASTPPFCWQFHQPCIVIPKTLLTYENVELKCILRHELAHLRTGHPMQVFLQRTVEIAFWFHPMVWWASREWSLAREFQCDDEAVESRGDIVRYLKTLLMIVEQTAEEARSAPTLTFVRNRCEMAERARRLVRIAQGGTLDSDRPSGTVSCHGRLGIAGLTAVFLIAMSLLWVPVNVLASSDSHWSPWPPWSARVLHDFGVRARDFEVYDHRYTLHELGNNDTDHMMNRVSATASPTE